MKYTVRALIAALPFTFISATHADIVTPNAGSSERKAILDALRPVVTERTKQEPTFYDVEAKTENGWAFVQATPKDSSGGKSLVPGSVVVALLKRDGSRWRVVQSEYTDENDSANKRVAILKNHPTAPALIFGGYAARFGYGTYPSIPYRGISLLPSETHDILEHDQTFLSLGTRDFHRGNTWTDAELIGFGVWIAQGKKTETGSEHLQVSASEVDTALARYIPQKITKHGTGGISWNPTTRVYTLTAGDGVEGDLTALSSVRKNSDGTYRAVIATVDPTTGRATGWRHMIFRRVAGNSNSFPTLEWAQGK